jgi:predicted AlkP superfamily pyrophosphatase or phosphodiesterase
MNMDTKYSPNARLVLLLMALLSVFVSYSCGRQENHEAKTERAAVRTPVPAATLPPQPEHDESSDPKLIVGIVVDQMAYDFLDRYWDKYGADGFKRLVNNGYSFRVAGFNYVPTTTCPGHASIYTGTTPSVNGIIGNDWFVRAPENSKTYCARDITAHLVGGSASSDPKSGEMSPKNLLTTTVTDELRLSTNMKAKVIGIALKDRAAIMPAGHLGNAAYWLDDESGRWVTSSYYYRDNEGYGTALPDWVKDFNQKYSAEKYLNKPGTGGEWKTLKKLSEYTESLPDDSVYEKSIKGKDDATGEYRKPVFPYVFKDVLADNKSEIKGRYGVLIKATPYGNSITKDFAIAAIKGEDLGKDNVTDFLTVSFSSTDIIGHYYGPRSVEVEDAYLRLDQDIADFLKALDETVGEDNYLVFLTADHGVSDVPLYLQDVGIPAGYFIDDNDLKDKLNDHLGKVFKAGGAKLVLSYSNQQVYLDRDLITGKLGLRLADVEGEAAAYLMTIDGVADVVTASELKSTDFTKGPRSLVENGFNRRRSGDLAVIMEPSWIEYKETSGKKGTTHGSPYRYDTHVPLIFYGWNIKHGSSVRPVDITDIAPTLSALLGIPFPNGATGNPLPELLE